MNRRKLLLSALVAAGIQLNPQLADAIAAGVADGDAPEQGLTAAQRKTLVRMIDLLIPATDTPGALDAGVPDFVERMIFAWLDEEERTSFVGEIDAVDKQSVANSGIAFADAEQSDCLAIMEALDKKQIWPFYPSSKPMPFFARFKELAVAGFFTSEVGATLVLRYNPVPGLFNGCTPYKEGDPAWYYGGPAV